MDRCSQLNKNLPLGFQPIHTNTYLQGEAYLDQIKTIHGYVNSPHLHFGKLT